MCHLQSGVDDKKQATITMSLSWQQPVCQLDSWHVINFYHACDSAQAAQVWSDLHTSHNTACMRL